MHMQKAPHVFRIATITQLPFIPDYGVDGASKRSLRDSVANIRKRNTESGRSYGARASMQASLYPELIFTVSAIISDNYVGINQVSRHRLACIGYSR